MKLLSYDNFLNESILTANDVINYITRITPSESDVPDYFFSLIKKSGKNFTEKRVKISDLLKADDSLREYVESGEERYGEDSDSEHEPHYEDLDLPIVIFDGEVIDGYNRTATKHRAGEEYIDAYVSI